MSEYITAWLDEIDMSHVREEIIRCKDCVSAHIWDVSSIYGNHDHDVMFCLRFVDEMRMTVEPDGFCAWGEQKAVE